MARIHVGDAVLGALIGAGATLLAPLVPAWVLPHTPDVRLVSARADGSGSLDLVLKNSGRGPGVVTALRLHVQRVRVAPELSAGGYLPILATYVAPPGTVDVQRVGSYTADIPAGTFSLGPGEVARVKVSIPVTARLAGTLQADVGAVVDGKIETAALPVEIALSPTATPSAVPSERETFEFLREFDAHFDPSRPPSEFFRVETQRDPITGKDVLVAVLQIPNVASSVRVAHVLRSEDIEAQLPLAAQSLAASNAGEFRSAQKMDATELGWMKEILGTLDEEWATAIRSIAMTLAPRAEGWLGDERQRLDDVERLLMPGQSAAPAALALTSNRIDGPRFAARAEVVHRVARAVACGVDRSVAALVDGPDRETARRMLTLDRDWTDLEKRTKATMKRSLVKLPGAQRRP